MNNGDKSIHATPAGRSYAVQKVGEHSADIVAGAPAQSGLTKREYFAGLAMQGILANHTGPLHIGPGRCAAVAVDHADALLKALENNNG